ncbi:MAG TPA: adenylosuccinate synthase [Bacilli bacterium]
MKEWDYKMSQTAVVIGSQWGDEGKGKITNYLSEKADVVVRYQGGDNAGHTICFNNTTYKLHLIPSGIFYPKTMNILGNGMVINPLNLVNEINELKALGFKCDNLYISDRAHVIFEYHLILDELNENKLGNNKIGTTKKGIGPAYTDKVARIGLRMADFVADDFPKVFTEKLKQKNDDIINLGGKALEIEKTVLKYQEVALILKPYVTDTILLLNEAHANGKKILFEGAQGALLDIDFGTYPYVTSSNPSSGGVAIGSGLGLTKIDEVLGIVKAYTTRVGEGPFPTELNNELGNTIREIAHEYGTTTKRPRRIGWFDGVVVRYSAMINGLTGISLMLLDVLTGFDELKICVNYTLDGKVVKTIPARLSDYSRCIPNYITLPGWKESIKDVKTFTELPLNARKYIETIEEVVGVPVVMFSVGPDKLQTIIRKEIF